MKRRLKLKITTVRRQIFKGPTVILRARCVVCGRDVEALTPTDAAQILQVADRVMDYLIADAQVHTIQSISGAIRVCKDSLFLSEEPSIHIGKGNH